MNDVKVFENNELIAKQDLLKLFEKDGDLPVVVKQKKLEQCEMNEPLENALFLGVFFEGVTFNGQWRKIEMQNCEFRNCAFQILGAGISFIGSNFINCTFNACRIPRADFTKCSFQDLRFVDSDFNRSNFTLSNYDDISVSNCKIENTLLDEKKQLIETQKEGIRKHMLDTYQAVEQILMLGVGNFEENLTLSSALEQLHTFICEENEKLKDSSMLQQMDKGDLEYKIREHEKVVDSPVKITEIPVIDLSQYDFSGYNFQGHNLSCINFSGSCLRNCCFAGCDLSGCDFTNCDLTGSIMFQAHFNQVNFDGAILENIILDRKNTEAFMKAGILSGGTYVQKKESDYM